MKKIDPLYLIEAGGFDSKYAGKPISETWHTFLDGSQSQILGIGGKFIPLEKMVKVKSHAVTNGNPVIIRNEVNLPINETYLHENGLNLSFLMEIQ